jgi:membrane protease YdiL (CAAX protease family)
MKIRTLIQSQPAAAYFVLAFVISWGGSFVAVGPKFLRGETIQLTDIWLIGSIMLVTVSTLGISLTYFLDGKDGLRDLFSRMRKWRVGARWYLALLIFPVLILAVLLPLSALVSPDFRPNFFPLGILMGLAAGFLEEIGWMGFAFPKMKSRYTILTAGIILGVLHVLWHFAGDYLGAAEARGASWLPHFFAFCVSMIAMRILNVWVYVNTGSLLMAQLMHASSTGFLAILVPMSLSPELDTLFYIVYSVVLWGAALIVIARYGNNLVQVPRQAGEYKLQAKPAQQ